MVGNTLEPQTAQVLVVEDEAEILELISLLLLRLGHRVQQCRSAIEAVEFLKKDKYDLLVLDWMLPHFSGIDLLKTMGSNKPPVLMVTAKSEPQDIVTGFEAGADDYITKPFEPSIFSARVKALLRRAASPIKSQSDILKIGSLKMNLASYEVHDKDELLHLTPSEFKILATLAQSRGRVLTRDHLIEIVQGEGVSVTGRTIDTHVFGLRKKIGDSADWIETIRGVGYRVKPE